MLEIKKNILRETTCTPIIIALKYLNSTGQVVLLLDYFILERIL